MEQWSCMEKGVLYLAALRSLARCLAPLVAARDAALGKGLDPGTVEGLPRGDELVRLQDAVRAMVAELHARRSTLSYNALAVTISGLVEVLPGAGWPLRDTRALHGLLRALPAAAEAANASAAAAAAAAAAASADANARTVALLPLRELCADFLSALQLADAARAQSAALDRERSPVKTGRNELGKLGKRGPVPTPGAAASGASAIHSGAKEAGAEEQEGEDGEEEEEDRQMETRGLVWRFLEREVLSGAAMRRRLEAAAMEELAAAAALVAEYPGPIPGGFTAALTQRADALIAAARRAARHGPTTPGAKATPVTELNVSALICLIEIFWNNRDPGVPGDCLPDAAWLVHAAAEVLATQDLASAQRRDALQVQLQESRALLEGLQPELKEAQRTALQERGRQRKRPPPQQQHKEQQAAAAAAAAAAEVVAGHLEECVARVEADIAAAERALAELGPPPAATQQRAEGWELVGMLMAVADRVRKTQGGPAGGMERRREMTGAELARRAEAVLQQRVDELEWWELVSTLEALAHMDHTQPSRAFIASALRALQPHIPRLPPSDAISLLGCLRAFGFPPNREGGAVCAPDGDKEVPAREVLSSLFAAALEDADAKGSDRSGTDNTSRSSGGRGGSVASSSARRDADAGTGGATDVRGMPTGLMLWAIRACEEWEVQLPAGALRRLEQEAERRLARFEQAVKCGADPDGVDSLLLRTRLLEGVVLPLARTGARLRSPALFAQALADWAAHDFGGLDARTATLLLHACPLRADAAGAARELQPRHRKVVVSLLERSLALRPRSPEEYVGLLLAVARVMRDMAAEQGSSSDASAEGPPDLTLPELRPLLPAALEHLLCLQPSAAQLAAVAHELFANSGWRGPEAQHDTMALPRTAEGQDASSATVSLRGALVGAAAGTDSDGGHSLLARMLDAAAPSLRACRLKSHALLLAACNAAGHVPPPAWRAQLYDAVAAAVAGRPHSGGGGGAQAGLLYALVDGVAELERRAAEEGATVQAPAATEPVSVEARGPMLLAVAQALLQEPVLQDASPQPGRLVRAVGELVGLGLAPPPEWRASFLEAAQGLLPRTEPADVARTAELAVRLQGPAPPPAAFLNALLERVADPSGFPPAALGSLLGSVHAMCGDTLLRAPSPQLSAAAWSAWDCARARFVSPGVATTEAYASYTAPQLEMVLTAVLSYELALPAGGGGGDVPSGRQGPGVSEEWLKTCCESLLQRRAAAHGAPADTLGAGAASLPPVALLLDLLRVASRVLCGRRDGGVADLAGSQSAAAARLLEYVRLSLTDLALAQAPDQQEPPKADVAARAVALSLDDWSRLLCTAQEAGIRPAAPELGAFSARLIAFVTDELQAARGGTHSQRPAAPVPLSPPLQAAWAQLESGLRDVLLPALPWAPPEQELQRLHASLLPRQEGRAESEGLVPPDGRVPVLSAASNGQLALLCSWWVQLGPQLAPGREVWQQVHSELMARLPPQLRQPGTEATDAAATAVPATEAAAATAAECTAADLAAVCYGLMLLGRDVPAEAAAWFHHLLSLEAVSSGGGGGGERLLAGAPAALRHLAALQALWVARGCGCLAELPEGVWSEAFRGLDRPRGVQRVAALRPGQLAQLVLLWSERQRAQRQQRAAAALAAVEAVSWCASRAEGSELWLAALAGCYTRMQAQRRKQRGVEALASAKRADAVPWQGEPPLDSATAALAVAYCLPPGGPDGSALESEPPPLPDFAGPLLTAALPAVAESLPPADVAAFLRAVDRPGWALPRPELDALVARLAGPSGGQDSICLLQQMPPSEALEVVLAVLSDCLDVAPCLPLLSALMPHAEAELHELHKVHDPPITEDEDGPDMYRSDANRSGSGHGSILSLPAAELARFALALVATAQAQPLPRPAAAVLMRLLCVRGVASRIPLRVLEHTFEHGLLRVGLPMPDAAAAAVYGLLAAGHDADRVVTAAAALCGCGARRVWVQRGLLRFNPAVVREYNAEKASALFQAMVSYGVFDPRQPLERQRAVATAGAPGRQGNTAAQTTATAHSAAEPYARLLTSLLRRWGQLASKAVMDLSGCARVLRHVAAMLQRLPPGAAAALELHAAAAAFAEATVKSLGHELPGLLESIAQSEPEALSQFLEAAHELGNQRFNSLTYQAALLQEQTGTQHHNDPRVPASGPSAAGCSERLAGVQAELRAAISTMAGVGPYLLTTGPAARIRVAIDMADMNKGVGQADVQASNIHSVSVEVAKAMELGRSNANPRQAGLAFGLLALRGRDTVDTYAPFKGPLMKIWVTAKFANAIQEFTSTYEPALARLAARTDLPPLEHLTAVLDALEPAVLADPWVVAPAAVAGEPRVPGPWDSAPQLDIEAFLAPPLARVVLGDVEPVPEGLAPQDDWLLASAPLQEPTEAALLAALPEPPQHAGSERQETPPVPSPGLRLRMPLPPSLAPTAGAVGGAAAGGAELPAGAAAAAALEAYVRSIAPWLMAARRVHRLALLTRRTSQLRDAVQARLWGGSGEGGKQAAPAGRWAALMLLALGCVEAGEPGSRASAGEKQ